MCRVRPRTRGGSVACTRASAMGSGRNSLEPFFPLSSCDTPENWISPIYK